MNAALHLTDEIFAELATLNIFPETGNRLHILVSKANCRSGHSRVVSHYCSGNLPTGSLLRVAPHVLMSSPELVFLQLARSYPTERLIMAGCELCGTYVLDAVTNGPDEVLAKRPALTTARALERFADSCMGFAGRDRARRAARYVFDNARSPMEAKLALLLCLPHRLGGRNLPRPTLNYPIHLTAEARHLYRFDSCKADLFWPEAAFDLEYNGGHHEEDRTHMSDVARTTALEAQGIVVMTVAYPQVVSLSAFALIADSVAAHLGRTLRIRRSDFPLRETALRSELRL